VERRGKMFTCQCCGYKTLVDNEHNYEICPICFWEDDPIQFENPFMAGGANEVSLITAQKNFILFESSEKRFKRNVRKIKESDEFDTEWRPELTKIVDKLIKEGNCYNLIEELKEEDSKEKLSVYYEALFIYDKNELKKIVLKELERKDLLNKAMYLNILAQYKSDKEIQEFFVENYLDSNIEKENREIVNNYLNEKSKFEFLSYKELIEIIEKEKLELDKKESEGWKKVEIVPKLWKVRNKSYFMWVVGIKGNRVIFYNEIKEGFNISTYHLEGIINKYLCNKYSLRQIINYLNTIK
jgi:hypothetical protein